MSTATDAEAPGHFTTAFRLFLAWLLPAMVVFLTVTTIARPNYDPDLWWHLAAGKWIVEYRAVTDFDPFSQAGLTTRWVAYSWLFEIVLYSLYSWLGLVGVLVYRVVLSLLILRAIHALVMRLQRHYLIAIGLTAAAIVCLHGLLGERPWMLTLLFCTITLHAVVVLRQEDLPRVPLWVWTLPLVYAAWANVHIQFVYGLGLLGLACVAPWVDRAAGVPARALAGRAESYPTLIGWIELGLCVSRPTDTAASPGSHRYRALVALSLVCALATLVNPYGYRVYVVVWEYATQPGPFHWVNELQALLFRSIDDWIMLALTGAACYALGRRTTSSFEPMLLVVAAAFAFRARRDIWFVTLTDLVILASAGPALVPARARFMPTLAGRAVILTGVALLIAATAWWRGLSNEKLEATVAKEFPVAATRYVLEHGYPGPLFNDYNQGGFLIWALKVWDRPDLRVSLDGRTNLQGDERTERNFAVWRGAVGWQDNAEFKQANLIFAPPGEPLVSLLRLQPDRFTEVYADDLAVVFVRKVPAKKD